MQHEQSYEQMHWFICLLKFANVQTKIFLKAIKISKHVKKTPQKNSIVIFEMADFFAFIIHH